MNTLFLYLLTLCDYRLGPLSIADWTLIFLLIRALLYKPVLYITDRMGVALALMGIGIILSTILNVYKPYFDFLDFILSFGKLVLYLLALFLVPQYLSIFNINYSRHLRNILVIATFGGLLQRAIVSVFGRSSWPLYSLGGHWFGLKTEITMFNNAGMMRSRSFWSEPAHFAIFISLVFILLLFIEKGNLEKRYYVVYVLGILLANSLSGYAIMIAIFALYLIDFREIKNVIKILLGLFTFAAALYVLIQKNTYLRGRVANLFALKDHSGVVRTIGGFKFLDYIPWYGVGIGNHANYYKSLLGLGTLWFSGSGEFYNNILLAIITMGYIGAVGFLLFEYQVLKKDKKIFVALIISHFGWGKLYTIPIWLFLILYILLKNQVEMVEDNENG